MPKISITKGANAITVARNSVLPGQVFALRTNGKLSTNNYAHLGTALGSTGRMYSVNLRTGELSSSTGDKQVQLTGVYKYVIDRSPAPNVIRECRRSDVQSGEVFHVNGKDTLYAHIGAINLDLEGWLSVPVSRTENHAVTRNPNSRVNVIGTFVLDVTMAL